MTLQSEPLKNKGDDFRADLLKLTGEARDGDFLLVPWPHYKVKWHNLKAEKAEWEEFTVTRVSTNCFRARPHDLPWWSVIEYKLQV